MEKTKKCPHCKVEVDSKASRCPHCHGKIYVWTMTKKIILGGILLIVVLMAGLDSGTPTPVVSTAEQIASLKKSSIRSFAKDYVLATLKSPSTAKFSTSPVIKQDGKDSNTFTIDSYVDSENGFGAMIRSYWSLKVHYIGADTEDAVYTGNNYKITEFIFDGEKVK